MIGGNTVARCLHVGTATFRPDCFLQLPLVSCSYVLNGDCLPFQRDVQTCTAIEAMHEVFLNICKQKINIKHKEIETVSSQCKHLQAKKKKHKEIDFPISNH